MRRRARVQLVGEVTGVGRSKVQAYFELRDAEGAVPCVIWLNDLERAGLPEGGLRDGAEVVIEGGPDYYPGGGQASPSFAFRATRVRLAGEGDLLARLEALRKQLAPRASSSSRSSCRDRCCRGRSASSPRRAAPPAATCSPGSTAAAGRGRSSGPSPRFRTGARRRRSPPRSRTSRRGPRSRRSSSPAAAAASPTSGPSATRPSAARSRCCGCRSSARSATSATRP